MSAKITSMQEWLDGLKEAVRDVGAVSLRFDGGKVTEAYAKASEKASDKRPGAYIAILGDGTSVHLGLSSTPQGCRALARALLGIRSDEDLSEKDAADGVSEILNIIAGKVKATMSDKDHSLKLGLPMFIDGQIHRDGVEHTTADVQIGPVPCQLHIFRSKRAA